MIGPKFASLLHHIHPLTLLPRRSALTPTRPRSRRFPMASTGCVIGRLILRRGLKLISGRIQFSVPFLGGVVIAKFDSRWAHSDVAAAHSEKSPNVDNVSFYASLTERDVLDLANVLIGLVKC
jgi:hypothetical protein